MKPFLQQVAEFYLDGYKLEELCFIFPNRRSTAFFRKYLSEVFSRTRPGAPVIAPQMLTMNDFFSKACAVRTADKVSLLLTLYGCWRSLCKKPEPLDEFIFWGDILLSDFDDVDKYLVEADKLFTNVSDWRKLQDDLSWMTESQREAIDKFIAHFRQSRPDGKRQNVKEEFLMIWELLLPLYRSFNEALAKEGLAYEGMIYRTLAERLDRESASDILAESFKGSRKFIFVGLNALNACEKKLLRKMRDAGIAEFCWDYSGSVIKDEDNLSSLFMKDNVLEFRPTFEPDDGGESLPAVNILSVPSSTGQAKQIGKILSMIPHEGLDTAVVLPDEGLLMPVLNSIPDDIRDINVTMGYPASGSGFCSLMNDIAVMQLHTREKDNCKYFYYKQVWAIFSNSVFRSLLDDEGRQKIADIKASAGYYISRETLLGHPVFDIFFSSTPEDVAGLQEWLLDVTSKVAFRLSKDEEMSMEVEFAKEYYLTVRRLCGKGLEELKPESYIRIIQQIIATVSVPFNGEPLKGLQIMGPLETRALDFRNLIILSCNEGVFPRHSVSSSFIPPELRKGFDMPTYEHQDAVWAYYFYRMIRRAECLWLLYDSRTEGIKSGEESRYIKQLEMLFKPVTTRYIAMSELGTRSNDGSVRKTEEHLEIIRNSVLSASAIQNYLCCPMKFYFHTVEKMNPESEVAESLDSGMLGNVFHNTMCALYLGEEAMDPSFEMTRENIEHGVREPLTFVTKDYIESWLKRENDIRARIRTLIMSELKIFEVSGKNLIYEDLILQYTVNTLKKELAHMSEAGVDRFRILGLEKRCYMDIGQYKFFGFIDRLDSFKDGEMRVVDYKSGNVKDQDININDDNAPEVVASLFGPSNKTRPKIALQLYLYDQFAKRVKGCEGYSISNSIYQPVSLFVSGIEDVRMSEVFCQLTEKELAGVLDEIGDITKDFTRTEEKETCEWCDFKMICGR